MFAKSSAAPWVAHKFGGTSVANADCYRKVAEILRTTLTTEERLANTRQGVVVSAMSGITDALLQSTRLAASRDITYKQFFEEKVVDRHLRTVQELLVEGTRRDELAKALVTSSANIGHLLKAIYLTSSVSDYFEELIAGHGEIWSAQLLNAFLQEQGWESEWMDARQVLCVELTDQRTITGQSPPINWEMSRLKLAAWFDNKGRGYDIIVITGFVASTVHGVPTTLKRNGSDYSGSIFGALLNATTTTIWTDVDGVYSADPRKVPDAILIDEMSYTEASEFSFHGAKIIHPKTMQPAMSTHTPIWIRNTFNTKCPGTKIHSSASAARSGSMKNLQAFATAQEAEAQNVIMGFCTIDNLSLVVVGGAAIGTTEYTPVGVRERLLSSLKDINVPLVLAAQAAPEHSIWFCVPSVHGESTKKKIEEDFKEELNKGFIHSVQLLTGYSVLTGVGDKISRTPGVVARFFTALHRANVNVLGVAQNGDRIVCVVVEGKNTAAGLRALHTMFKIPEKSAAIGVIGTGLIGDRFLQVLKNYQDGGDFDVNLRCVTNRHKMWLTDHGSYEQWQSSPSESSVDLDRFIKHLAAAQTRQRIVIDCSGSPEVAKLYSVWQSNGINVVTCNKALENDQSTLPPPRRSIGSLSVCGHLLFDLALGAGVPLPKYLVHLRTIGEQVLTVEGVLSATWSYILNNLSPADDVTPSTKTFSELVRECSELGLLEKDPRDDICGRDAARTMALIAHFCGAKSIRTKDVTVASLLPAPIDAGSYDDFWKILPSYDAAMAAMVAEARASGHVVRLVGRYTAQNNTCQVTLDRFPFNHPFARLRSCEKCFHITTNDNGDGVILQAANTDAASLADALHTDMMWLLKLVNTKTQVR